MKKLLIGMLQTVYGVTKVEADSIVKKFANEDGDEIIDADGMLNEIETLQRKAIAKRKEEETDILDQGYKKAQKKILSDLEDEIKETYDVDSDLRGLELIKHVVSTKAKPGKEGEITEEQIKTHPFVTKLVSDHAKELKRKDDEHKNALESKLAEISKAELLAKAKKLALAELEKRKPILSSDPKKAAKQKEIALRELDGFEFKEVDGKIEVWKNGQPHKNSLGHLVEFEEMVDGVLQEYYDFEESEEKEFPEGDKSKKKEADKKLGFKLPETNDEYLAIMTNDSISNEDKIKAREHWDKNKK